MRFGVLVRHLGEPEGVAALGCEREADKPAAVLRHEVDRIGRHQLGRRDEIAFVLAIFIIGDDDELAGFDGVDRLLNGSEAHIPSFLTPGRKPGVT